MVWPRGIDDSFNNAVRDQGGEGKGPADRCTPTRAHSVHLVAGARWPGDQGLDGVEGVGDFVRSKVAPEDEAAVAFELGEVLG